MKKPEKFVLDIYIFTSMLLTNEAQVFQFLFSRKFSNYIKSRFLILLINIVGSEALDLNP